MVDLRLFSDWGLILQIIEHRNGSVKTFMNGRDVQGTRKVNIILAFQESYYKWYLAIEGTFRISKNHRGFTQHNQAYKKDQYYI